MKLQRWIAQNILNTVKPHDASHAYAPGCDLVNAAQRHAGCRWLVKMDVRSFFESITERAVYRVFRALGYNALLSFEMSRLCTRLDPDGFRGNQQDASPLPYQERPEGHLPQGAPTSPMLANLAVRRLDDILDAISKVHGWVYTRYADDLAFSTWVKVTRGTAACIARLAERELVAFGLAANRQKTTIVPPGARKILLGLLVDRDRVRLTREFRNNIETHLYALTNPKIGPVNHQRSRAFVSIIGMRRHIEGLIAFAHQVDPQYARGLRLEFERVNWMA
jgi:RNA-directed DNA polymerase